MTPQLQRLLELIDQGYEYPDAEIKFHLYRMPMVDGCYDTGGAYWGTGSNKLGYMYHAYGDGPQFVNQCFVRARSRNEAKSLVGKVFRNARFFR